MTSVDKITEIFWSVDKIFKKPDARPEENLLAASRRRRVAFGKQAIARSCLNLIVGTVPPRPKKSVSSRRVQFPKHIYDARHKKRPEEALLAFTELAVKVHLPNEAEGDHIAVVARPMCMFAVYTLAAQGVAMPVDGGSAGAIGIWPGKPSMPSNTSLRPAACTSSCSDITARRSTLPALYFYFRIILLAAMPSAN